MRGTGELIAAATVAGGAQDRLDRTLVSVVDLSHPGRGVVVPTHL